MRANPFTPTFGTSPSVLLGRDELLAEFKEGLDDGPGAAARATIYTGARGTGKTVMLNEVGDIAESHGWYVIHETAYPGFVERITNEALPRILSRIDPAGGERTRVESARVAGVGASWKTDSRYVERANLRGSLNDALDILAENGAGLLVTLDEIQFDEGLDEMRHLGATIQHLFREGREIAFAGAGLPEAISSLLNDRVLTFLQRSDRHTLGAIPVEEVAAAFSSIFEEAGRELSPTLAQTAAVFTSGYPYLIQLTGNQIWRLNPAATVVSEDDVHVGIEKARRRLGSLVIEPTLRGISDVDKSFLLAMARDDGPSRMKDIAERMGCDSKYASVYRIRLIEAGLIETSTYGKVQFSTPTWREYLREHVAYHASGDETD